MSLEEFLSQIFLSLENFLQKVSLKENLTHTSDWKRTNSESFCNILPVNPIFSDVPLSPAKTDNWSNEETKVDFEDVSVTAEDNKTNYKCQQCGRKFRTNARFSSHVCKTSSSEIASRPLISDCDESSECVDDVDIEYPVSNQADLPVFVCSSCLSSFPEANQFEQHTCMNSSNEKPTLVLSQKQLEKMRSFVCGMCCETYRSLNRISYHVLRCRAGPYCCELCSQEFSSRHDLNIHKKKSHKGVECFFCGECGLGFQLRASLQKHQVNRHESEQGKYTCDIEGCNNEFTKRIYLTNHKLVEHGVERKYLCQMCGRKFLTRTSLAGHLESHNQKNKYQCSICSKVMCTKEKLTFHIRTHTGEKPFACEMCSKSFISKAKLLEHVRRHRGEKPHTCGICSKTYANKIDLTHHLKKIHSPKNTNSTEEVAVEPASSVSMLVQLDNAGPVYPLHIVDVAPQYYQTEPLQLVRTMPVSMSTQNIVLGYETISYQ
uniref:C2H2-type domain-containing protein n=1 Tax=Clastoptera arizonana TaxID=38151 RepID=A0A1B6C2N0_9HEMI